MINLLQKKERLCKENGMNIIKIYPQDLFPKNRLDRILHAFLK